MQIVNGIKCVCVCVYFFPSLCESDKLSCLGFAQTLESKV